MITQEITFKDTHFAVEYGGEKYTMFEVVTRGGDYVLKVAFTKPAELENILRTAKTTIENKLKEVK